MSPLQSLHKASHSTVMPGGAVFIFTDFIIGAVVGATYLKSHFSNIIVYVFSELDLPGGSLVFGTIEENLLLII